MAGYQVVEDEPVPNEHWEHQLLSDQAEQYLDQENICQALIWKPYQLLKHDATHLTLINLFNAKLNFNEVGRFEQNFKKFYSVKTLIGAFRNQTACRLTLWKYASWKDEKYL